MANGLRRSSEKQRRVRPVLLAGVAAAMLAPASLLPSASPAHAAFGVIEDEGLAACVNESIGGGRDPQQEITADDLKQVKMQFRCSTGPGITSFAGFEGATNVLSITLSGPTHQFTEASDLEALGALPKLRTLYLNGVGLTNDGLAGLSGTTHLETLTLADLPEVSDLSGISNNAALSTLILTPLPALSDLEPLRGLAAVTRLDLTENTGITDLSALAGMSELKDLTIQFTGVSDLTPLSDNRTLMTLSATGTNIASLAPLADASSLRAVWVANTKLTSLDGLEGHANLTQIFASGAPLGGDIAALAHKPNLQWVDIRNTQTTSLAVLADSPNISTLDASDNRISSLVGIPEQSPGSTFNLLNQNIHIEEPKQYVPVGATEFRVDAAGQVSLRDGTTFPPLYDPSVPPRGPVADPELPLLKFSKIQNNDTFLDYKFREGAGFNSFAGNVDMKIVWSSITSGSPAPVAAGERLAHQVTVTEGFPVTTYALGADAPDWLAIDPATGLLSGTPPTQGEFEVEVLAADRLGNTITGTLTITATEATPALRNSVISVGADQAVNAGEELTFTITRENAAENPWTGEAAVKVRTQDGTAVAGVDYDPVATELVWAAGETAAKQVAVTTKTPEEEAVAAKKHFALMLTDPSLHVELGSRAKATGTITVQGGGSVTPGPGPKPGVVPEGGKNAPGGHLANTGSDFGTTAGIVGAMLLAVAACVLCIRRRQA
ncbi:Calx-beta domain-containing protein [Leucobacter sp. 1207-22]|uniref:Calx-beta domain-containing protein n=1 Tax=Leucobacter sp. 1207-22 TaxID=2604456 RepID=UPI00406326F7